MAKLEVVNENKLQWPDDRPRTRFQDRKAQAAWKLTYAQTMEGLVRELRLINATYAKITHNTPGSEDGGVALWMSRKPVDDYGWQDALGFIGVVPTEKEITHAYMERIRKIHPDGPTPNRVAFDELTKHRDNARRWVSGKRNVEPETVMALDAFKEVRHNLNAIKIVLSSLRAIHRCGDPVMYEQAFRGFRPAIAQNASPDSKGVSDVAVTA